LTETNKNTEKSNTPSSKTSIRKDTIIFNIDTALTFLNQINYWDHQDVFKITSPENSKPKRSIIKKDINEMDEILKNVSEKSVKRKSTTGMSDGINDGMLKDQKFINI